MKIKILKKINPIHFNLKLIMINKYLNHFRFYLVFVYNLFII